MATAVYDVVEIELQDGTAVTLRPLAIKQMRLFMKSLENLGKAPEEGEEEKDGMEQIVDLVKICLEKNKTAAKIKDYEEALDLPTAYKIIEVCTGIDLADPKLMEAAATAMAMESAGQN